ncbi:thiol peroxidase [Thioalkalivibrio sp.]|uniref:thiol peroxidase n=1 Tax=Thioalkalivibrio sp. TaxID=2093813 RepID=UPI0012D58F55|nr:thiol peroxidase [Thioalkalivibrio sp.]TVP76732.1 MAG: thiol peroxidase [Thioalkalivibrio sp.]
MAEITRKGIPIHTNGELPAVGSTAPDFRLTKNDLSDVGLEAFAGKSKILSIVPSLDTGVCADSTRKFDQLVANHDDVVVLVISADLPFAQGRFCGAAGIDRVQTLSMMRSRNFAKDYGVLVQDGPTAGITARAVVVLDAENRVLHAELVPDTGHEPDYDAAFAALR